MKQNLLHSKKKPILRIGKLYISKTGLLITFFTMFFIIVALSISVVVLYRSEIHYVDGDAYSYAEGDAYSFEDTASYEYSYTLISVTPINCSLQSYSNTKFNITLDYSAYGLSFDKLVISLRDIDTDSPSASATVSAISNSNLATLGASKTIDGDYITIRIYGIGPYFSNYPSNTLLLTAVYILS